jgi:hypothetical protein
MGNSQKLFSDLNDLAGMQPVVTKILESTFQ